LGAKEKRSRGKGTVETALERFFYGDRGVRIRPRIVGFRRAGQQLHSFIVARLCRSARRERARHSGANRGDKENAYDDANTPHANSNAHGFLYSDDMTATSEQ